MRISQEADYALRIIDYLSKIDKDQRNDAKDIASNINLPHRFAVKILRKLNMAGFTKSFRGAHGGYVLNMDKKEISFLDIIECIDGKILINKCLHQKSVCSDNRNGNCYVHKKLNKVNEQIVKQLSSITF